MWGLNIFSKKYGFFVGNNKFYSFIQKKCNPPPRKIPNYATDVIGNVWAYNSLEVDMQCTPCTLGSYNTANKV